MFQTSDTLKKIAEWKAKQDAGTMTQEDWRQAMEDLRAARSGASAAIKAKRAANAPVDVAALKEGLKALRKTP